MTTDELRAKCVFGQLTLGEAFDLFDLGRSKGVQVVKPSGPWSHWNFDYCKKHYANRRDDGDRDLLWIGDRDDPDPRWLFSLNTLVEIKNNYILVEGIDDCAGEFYEVHFFEQRPLSFDLAQIIRA